MDVCDKVYCVDYVMMSWKTVLYIMNTTAQKHAIKLLIIKSIEIYNIISLIVK